MNRSESASLLALAYAQWPGTPIAESNHPLWAGVLKPHDYDKAKAALLRLLRTATAPPAVGDIISALEGRRGWSTAWSETLAAVSRLGVTRAVVDLAASHERTAAALHQVRGVVRNGSVTDARLAFRDAYTGTTPQAVESMRLAITPTTEPDQPLDGPRLDPAAALAQCRERLGRGVAVV